MLKLISYGQNTHAHAHKEIAICNGKMYIISNLLKCENKVCPRIWDTISALHLPALGGFED